MLRFNGSNASTAPARDARSEGENRGSRMPTAHGHAEAGRAYSLGWRLVRSGSLELSVKAARRDTANDDTDPEHDIGFTVTVRCWKPVRRGGRKLG